MKKRLLVFFLTLTLCFSCFIACDSNTEPPKPDGEPSTDSNESESATEENKNYDEVYSDPYDVYAELTSRGYTGTFEEWVESLKGADGADGKSAYQLAVENGYTGTVEEWLTSLIGSPGKDGADGKDGVDGALGKDGADGKDGVDGAPGKDGADGKDGKSVYDLAVENGFEGTVEEWLKSLVGADGKDGKDGVDGVPGKDGDKGDKGETGAAGNGIVSISKTASEGLADTYTITFTDGSTTTFTVTNGAKGDKGDSGEKGESIVPMVATRNLANLTYENAYIASGEYRPLADGVKNAASPDYIAVKGGTSYKLSCDVIPIDIKPRVTICMYDENKTWISGSDQHINTWSLFHGGYAIKTHADCRYIRVAFTAKNSNTVAWQDVVPPRFQIEEGYRTGYVPPFAIDSSHTNAINVAQSGYAAYGLPILEFKGDMSNISKDNSVTVTYWYGDKNGTCTLKWQGAGSMQYPKKNYTVKFDTAFEAKEGWGEQKKYCLKANFMDFSHSRNICSAKLWGSMVKSREVQNERLNALPNGGAIDGFPICVVINGEYQGLYTFNIPKDKWMFGMGEGEREAILCANASNSGIAACKFRAEATVTEADFEIEYASDEDDTAWINESLNRLIRACMNCDSEADFEANVAPYLDVESAIDYYIFCLISQNLDGIIRNYLLSTYDGTKWFFTVYDCDTVFGLYFGANGIMPNDGDGVGYNPCSVDDLRQHLVFDLIVKYKADEFKARYESLVKGYTGEWGNALTEDRFIDTFYNFIGSIPKALYDEEVKLWPTIPLTSVNNVSQIIDHYRRRRAFIDPQVEALK